MHKKITLQKMQTGSDPLAQHTTPAAQCDQCKARQSGLAIAASYTSATKGQTISSPYILMEISTDPLELHLNGTAILPPNGSTNSITVFLHAADFDTITARWLKF
jgi:hypothetical protein